MKNIIIRLVFVLTVSLFISNPISAAAQIDANTIAVTVDRFITQMQQETIKKNFASLLLKDEMKTKMMAERVPQNFMQSDLQPIIQPVMIEKIRAQMRAQQMELLKVR